MNRKVWLVTLTAFGVAILFALGWWQKERLAWKTDYLAEVEAAVTAEPVASFAEIERLLDDGAPLNYRRVQLDVTVARDAPVYRVFRGNGFRWEVFTLVGAGGRTLYVGLDEIENDEPIVADVPERVMGYIRSYDADDLEGGNYSVAENRYYIFNQGFTWRDRGEPFATLYIDHDPSIAPSDAVPVRRPDIPNNHFQYMLTWWSFAVILIIVSSILYSREP